MQTYVPQGRALRISENILYLNTNVLLQFKGTLPLRVRVRGHHIYCAYIQHTQAGCMFKSMSVHLRYMNAVNICTICVYFIL